MVKAITYILKEDSTVGALLGNNAAGTKKKVYPMYATQKEDFPLITVWEVGRVPEQCKGQRSTSFRYSYEVHVFDRSYDSIEALAIAASNALEDAVVTSPVNGVQFTTRIVNVNRRDGGYIDDYKAYSKILSFEATTNEGQST